MTRHSAEQPAADGIKPSQDELRKTNREKVHDKLRKTCRQMFNGISKAKSGDLSMAESSGKKKRQRSFAARKSRRAAWLKESACMAARAKEAKPKEKEKEMAGELSMADEEVAARLHEARRLHEATVAGGGWVRLTEAQHALVRYDYTPVIKHARGYIITVKRAACITDERTYYWLPHYEALGKWPLHYLVIDELCFQFACSHPKCRVVPGGASCGCMIVASSPSSEIGGDRILNHQAPRGVSLCVTCGEPGDRLCTGCTPWPLQRHCHRCMQLHQENCSGDGHFVCSAEQHAFRVRG